MFGGPAAGHARARVASTPPPQHGSVTSRPSLRRFLSCCIQRIVWNPLSAGPLLVKERSSGDEIREAVPLSVPAQDGRQSGLCPRRPGAAPLQPVEAARDRKSVV